jgi:hypothetical protein
VKTAVQLDRVRRVKATEEKQFKKEFRGALSDVGLSPAEFFAMATARQPENKEGSEVSKAMIQFARDLDDDSMLLKYTRSTQEYGMYIIRMLVMEGFFFDFWKDTKVSYVPVKSDVPPYFRMNVNTRFSRGMKHQRQALRKLIEQMLQIPISYGGLGRKEKLDALVNIASKAREEEMLGQMGAFRPVDPRPGGGPAR